MAKRMTPDELKKRLGDDDLVVVDVRSADKYEAGHVPGALHIPVAEIKKDVPDLPKEKQIVTY